MAKPSPYAQANRLLRRGSTEAELIAAGHRPRVVAATAYRLGLRDAPPKPKPRRIRRTAEQFRLGKIPTGGSHLTTVLRDLPDDALEWLINAVPPGGTIAEFVRSIIIDAHAEETE
jgi:hypothetical protein